jgi:hypothetical protein
MKPPLSQMTRTVAAVAIVGAVRHLEQCSTMPSVLGILESVEKKLGRGRCRRHREEGRRSKSQEYEPKGAFRDWEKGAEARWGKKKRRQAK